MKKGLEEKPYLKRKKYLTRVISRPTGSTRFLHWLVFCLIRISPVTRLTRRTSSDLITITEAYESIYECQ
jgi:hypothetical protein